MRSSVVLLRVLTLHVPPIVQRRDFKDNAGVKSSSGNLLFSLLDIWKPIQQEVRALDPSIYVVLADDQAVPQQISTLLHDYIDVKTESPSSRDPILSINDVLRHDRPRDSSKVSYCDLRRSYSALLDPMSTSANIPIQ